MLVSPKNYFIYFNRLIALKPFWLLQTKPKQFILFKKKKNNNYIISEVSESICNLSLPNIQIHLPNSSEFYSFLWHPWFLRSGCYFLGRFWNWWKQLPFSMNYCSIKPSKFVYLNYFVCNIYYLFFLFFWKK